MAVEVAAVFKLLDEASGPLRKIRAEAKETDKALRSMGSGGSSGNFNAAGMTRQFSVTRDGINSIGTATSNLRTETEKTSSKVSDFDRFIQHLGGTMMTHVGIVGRLTSAFDSLGRKVGSVFSDIANKAGTVVSALTPVAQGFAAVGGAVGGLLTALPLLATAVLLLTPFIVALGGAIGGLVGSLTAAVGGGVLLGGGLLGSFAIGIGSVMAVAKPAITQLKAYETAQKALNTAIASGSVAQIRAKQKALDALAKEHPGVAQLADSLKGLSSQWDKLTKSGRESFFKLAADGINTLKADLPNLAGQVNKTVGAIQTNFKSILEPFLKSDIFKGLIDQLGSIFRANLPGIFRGLIELLTSFRNILKTEAPELKNFGSWFQDLMTRFQNWSASGSGIKDIKGMMEGFKDWMRLLGNLLMLLLRLGGGTASAPGTSVISHWADALKKWQEALGTPGGQKGLSDFFSTSFGHMKDLAGTIKNVGAAFMNFFPVLNAIGLVLGKVLKITPPAVLTALAAGFLGFKAVSGATAAVRGTGKALGATSKWLSERGDSPIKPVFVEVTNRGFGGGTEGSPAGSNPVSTATSDAQKVDKAGSRVSRGVDRVVTGAKKVAGAIPFVGTALAVLEAAHIDPVKGAAWYFNNAKPSLSMPTSGPSYAGPRMTIGPSGRPVLAPAPRVAPAASPYLSSAHTVAAPSAGAVGGAAPGSAAAALVALQTTLRQVNAAFAGLPGARSSGTASSTAKGVSPTISAKGVTDFVKAATGPLVSFYDTARKNAADLKNTMGKPITDVTKTATGNVQDFSNKGQSAIQNLHDNGSNILHDLTKNVSTESVDQAKTIDSLGTAVATGLNDMITKVNAALKSFGVGKAIAAVVATATNTAGGVIKFASGGRIPGPASGDHVPLYGRGGGLLGIADGGELVVNRHTESRVNSKLARFGTSLGKEVAGETRPHFATGGRIVTASDFGGPNDPSAFMHSTASGKIMNGSLVGYAELSNPPGSLNFSALGHLPMGTMLPVTYNGKTITIPKVDVGAGGSGLNGHVRAIDLTQPAANQLNFPGLADVIIGNPAGISLGGGGGGGVSAPQIKLPVISGPAGGFNNLGNAMMKRAHAAAQAFVNSKAPTGGPGGGLGGGAAPMTGPAAVQAMIREADSIASHHYNYEWGGGHGSIGVPGHGSGHGSGPGVGFDCSGAVSAVLGAAGYLRGPLVAGDFMNWGAPGAGKNVSIWASPSHTFMALNGHYFGTSGMNPGGGADWIPHFPESMPALRHPPGLAMGGALDLAGLPIEDQLRLRRNPGAILPGMAQGGRIPWFGNGADFIAHRPQLIGVGDGPRPERVTVAPVGGGKRGVHIDQIVVNNHRPGDIREQIKTEVAGAFDDLARQLDFSGMEDSDSVMIGG